MKTKEDGRTIRARNIKEIRDATNCSFNHASALLAKHGSIEAVRAQYQGGTTKDVVTKEIKFSPGLQPEHIIAHAHTMINKLNAQIATTNDTLEAQKEALAKWTEISKSITVT